MGKKILDSKILYIVLSIILSVALWFYVTSQEGNLNTKTIKNIPITFTGVDILEERNLMITSSTPTATVEVRATPTVLYKLNDESIRLTVNVSQITEASEYTLAYSASLPAGVSQNDVEFISGQTGNVTFTVSRFISREVEVRGKFVGTVAEHYLPGDNEEFIFAPKKIVVSGQANLVNQVDHVLITVDGDRLTDPINGEYPYQLIGVDGVPLDGLDVSCSEDVVYVTYPIWATKEIELDVNFITGGGVSQNNISYTLSTDRITVAGTKEVIESVTEKSITLATINLADVNDGDSLTYAIPLADELTNLSNITEVTVTINFPPNMSTKTFHITEIAYLGLPEGWTAQMVTQVLPVEVRGRTDILQTLIEENIRVVVDLKDINTVSGQYSLPVKIYLNSVGTAEQIGVKGTDYKVVISLSEIQPEDQAVVDGQE